MTLLSANWVHVVVTIGQGIVLMPIYLKSIPVEALGLWLVISQAANWAALVDPGIGDSVRVGVAEAVAAGDTQRATRALRLGRTAAGFAAAGTFPIAVALGFAASAATKGKHGLTEVAAMTLLAAAGLASTLLSHPNAGYLQGTYSSARFGLVLNGGSLIGVATTLTALRLGWAALAPGIGLLARSLSWAIGSRAFTNAAVRETAPPNDLDRGAWRPFLRRSGSLGVTRLVGLVSNQLDGAILGSAMGAGAVVTYTVNTRPSDIVRQLLDKILGSLEPLLASEGEGRSRQHSRAVRRVVVTSFLAAGAAALLVALFNQVVVTKWVGPGQSVGGLLPFAVAGYVVSSFAYGYQERRLFIANNAKGLVLMAAGAGIVRLSLVSAALVSSRLTLAVFPMASILAACFGIGIGRWGIRQRREML